MQEAFFFALNVILGRTTSLSGMSESYVLRELLINDL